MRTQRLIFSSLLSLFFISIAANLFAQGQQMPMKTDFSDEELKNFISVNEEVVKVQQEAEQEMMQVIDSEDGITVERFNEIAQAQQNPDMEVNIGDEEMMAFRNAAQKVMDVQRETEAEVAEVVEEEGMAFEDYRQIMMAYQQDPELQQRIQSMIQENPN